MCSANGNHLLGQGPAIGKWEQGPAGSRNGGHQPSTCTMKSSTATLHNRLNKSNFIKNHFQDSSSNDFSNFHDSRRCWVIRISCTSHSFWYISYMTLNTLFHIQNFFEMGREGRQR